MYTKISNMIAFKALALFVAFTILLFTTSNLSASEPFTIKAGVPVSLQLVNSISSDNSSQGEIIDFRLHNDIRVNNVVVIPAGTQAKGQVVSSKPAKGMGEPGHLSIEVKNILLADGTLVDLSNPIYQNKGEDKALLAWAVGGGLFFLTCIGGIAVFLIKGGEAEFLSGHIVSASITSDTNITLDGI